MPTAELPRRWAWPALAAVLAVGLAFRLWGIRQGLPYAYNADEADHFVPRAARMFTHGLDPHYFANPPAYTYLLHILFAIAYGGKHGVLHTFEYSEKHGLVAAESFRKAGVASRAHIHVGPALQTLREIEAEAPFDLVFIDADKVSYPAYLRWAADHLREGGVVLADNAFGFGEIHLSGGDEGRAALRKFNQELAQGGRFRATMLPTAEGLAMGVKIR